jgi:hypothetical protein
MLRRLLLVMSVAALMAAMVALTAVPAFATVHPLANSECANASASSVATSQEPPGLTPVAFGGTGKSQGSPPNNPTDSTLAQPLFAASGGDPFTEVEEGPPSPAFKTFGPTMEELDAPFCPANNKQD